MSIVDEAKKEVKNNKKKEVNMKKTIILTVIATLVVIAAFAAVFIAGVSYESHKNSQIKAEAISFVKATQPEVKPIVSSKK